MDAPSLRGRIVNAVGFQAAWFACVAGAAQGLPWLGPAVALVLGAGFLIATRPRGQAALLLLVAAASGALVDGALVAAGAFEFTPRAGGAALVAPWMIALWIAFATTLPWSLSFLRGRALLAVVLGAISGPLAYAAGARLGAITLAESVPRSLGAIGLAWAIALPVLARASDALLGGERSER